MLQSSSSSRGGGRGGGVARAPPPPFQLDYNVVEQQRVRPLRPSVGTAGKKIRLLANSYSMMIPDKDCYHYDVEIRPETLPAVNRRIFEQWMVTQGSFEASLAVYDGRKNLYTPRLIPIPDDGQELQVTLTEAGSDRAQNFNVKVRKVATINMERLHQFLQTQKEADLPRDALTILDLLLAARPKSLFTGVIKGTGSSFYQAYNPQFNIAGGLNLRQGWKQSIKVTYKEVMLNLDVACTAFYRSGSLLDTVAAFFNRNRIQDINPRQVAPGTVEFQRLSKFLANVTVDITYRQTGRRKYKIRGLSKQTPDQAIITREEDKTTLTVSQYFLKEFNLKMQFPFLPLVMCGNEGQVLLPMEVLMVKEGQRHLGKLSDVQTSDVIKIAAVAPPERMKRISEGREKLHGGEQDARMQEWGVSVRTQMKQVEGRILPPPTLTGSTTIVPQNGAYDLSKVGSCKFFRPARMEFWAVAVFGDTRNMPFEAMGDFLGRLFRDCVNRGMYVSKREFKDVIVAQRRNSVEETLMEANKRALDFGRSSLPPGTPIPNVAQIILCVFDRGGPLYDEIKFFAETKLKILTQCFQSKHLPPRGPKSGVCLNISFKLNSKLGGVNMIVDPQKELNVLGRPIPTMIMGADVTHPPAGAQGGVSIASLVASIDSKFAEYRGGIKVQGPREEIISDLNQMTADHLNAFQLRAKGRYPERLIFFRDGVSEGQFGEVALQEVQKLKIALTNAGAGNCKLTFLVINKRHSHRFFVQDQRDGDRKGNVMAGTVVDSGITHPFEFDFFLNSHQGLQGTSRSSHYHVLYDENAFSANDLQEICYKMCYLYASASRSVSIVPAVYYAHLLAYRARCYRPGGVGGSSEMAGSTGSGGIESAAIDEFRSVTDQIKQTMFFI
ncbi:argonaute 1 [Podochytrium sp. JEL0797]|nr:argonaute 1 [Podochytrium sp. JEL0797]